MTPAAIRALIERLRLFYSPTVLHCSDEFFRESRVEIAGAIDSAAAALEATLAPVVGEDNVVLQRISDTLRDALSGREDRYRLHPGGYIRWGLVESEIRDAVAARLAAQAREIAELRADYARESEALTQAIEQVAAERARAEAAEKDARLAKWVRAHAMRNPESSVGDSAYWSIYCGAALRGPTLDTAIDAALREEQKR